MSTEPPKAPPVVRETNDLSNVQSLLLALCGSGNIVIGTLMLLFTEKPQYEPHIFGMVGLAFVGVGLWEKALATAEFLSKR